LVMSSPCRAATLSGVKITSLPVIILLRRAVLARPRSKYWPWLVLLQRDLISERQTGWWSRTLVFGTCISAGHFAGCSHGKAAPYYISVCADDTPCKRVNHGYVCWNDCLHQTYLAHVPYLKRWYSMKMENRRRLILLVVWLLWGLNNSA